MDSNIPLASGPPDDLLAGMEIDDVQEDNSETSLIIGSQKHTHVTWSQIIGGSIGNILEWYDFAVFGYLAQPIGTNFFPSDSQTAELLQTYGVFAGAFMVRPIGGALFGLLGDKKGRKLALQLSMAMIFIATFLMGCLPTYHQISIWAPILLTALRLFQGMSVGGQLVGSMIFLVESSNSERRGFYGSVVMCFAVAGTMSGAWCVSFFEAVLSEDDMNRYGWRIPFLLSCVMGVIGFITQYRMEGSPEFDFASKSQQIIRNPLNKAVMKYWRQILVITTVVSPWCAGSYACFLWLPTYLENEHTPPVEHAFVVNSFMLLWQCCCLLFGGWLSDKFSYIKVMMASSVLLVLTSIPCYFMVEMLTDNDQTYPLIIAQTVVGFLLGLYAGPMQSFMVSYIDDVVVRYCVVGLGYNLGQALFGGTAPIVGTLLAQVSLTLVGVYVALLSLCAFVTLFIKYNWFTSN